uniref:Protein PBN1 n=1 Tax=Blastobotrys adeninivorans TaxID=409370 RepID=A0A060TBR2_BLAAD
MAAQVPPVRHRHLFVLDYETQSDEIENFVFKDDHVVVEHQTAPREDRITVPSEALSAELADLLAKAPEKVQISYSRPSPYKLVGAIKVPAERGLRVDTSLDGDWESMDALVKGLVGSTTMNQSAVIETPNWKSFVDSGFAEVAGAEGSEIARHFDPRELKYADSIVVSKGLLPVSAAERVHKTSEVILEVYWSGPSRERMAADLGPSIIPPQRSEQIERAVEVGMLALNPDYYVERHEFPLSGLLRKVGYNEEEDYRQILVAVSLLSRYSHNSSFTGGFEQPMGLHPRHKLTLTGVKAPTFLPSCKLFAKYNIPRSLFLDKYQLQDLERETPSAPASGKLIGVWGESDLEAPVWEVQGWGSEAVVQIYPPDATGQEFNFTLPMHSRYEVPQEGDTKVDHEMPLPFVFWACANIQDPLAGEYPAVAYESLFPPNTVFYRVPGSPYSEPESVVSPYSIPVAPVQSFGVVQLATVVAVLGGFLYLVLVLLTKPKQPKEKKQDKVKKTQ